MMASSLTPLPTSPTGRCPVCGAPLVAPVWSCGRCETLHHDDCARYFGGCAIFGCRAGHSPETIERESWPRAMQLIARYTAYRSTQNTLIIRSISFLAVASVVSLWSSALLVLAWGVFLAAGITYIGIDVLAFMTRFRLNRTLGSGDQVQLEVSTKRIRELAAGAAGGRAVPWVGPGGFVLLVLGLASAFLGLEAGGILVFPGLLLLALREHLGTTRAQLDVLLNRVQATLAPRLPRKPGRE